ncbi:hypothetical protein JAAARDRAFT_522858 [Jaapia argillacea MUCL 33604]|uniref:Uncharacterized protein n=1 Tax=Jaapia argillacea MUCL 33604 TaxID=933084 RepID=A0A067Q6L7_9AGAM|nr:hypothetical protein JAAARDRAFT_522858 [Jaapia argillacea MUCL 33604]
MSSTPPVNASVNASPADPKRNPKRYPLWTFLPANARCLRITKRIRLKSILHTLVYTKPNSNPISNNIGLPTSVHKPSTSWRILLADTQSQLQKFSGSVDRPFKYVEGVGMRVREVEGWWESGFEALRGQVGDWLIAVKG